MAKQAVNLLPSFFRSDKNSKFLSSTVDQLIADPNLERLDGFIGSKLSKNYNPNKDQYISDPLPLRNKYQLEPGLVIKNLDASIKKAYGYDDLINQISFYGGNVDNLNRLFKPEFYSYDPQIDWDKFINFKEYYWLPTGPGLLKITGTQREVVSTYTVTDSADGNYFIFTPDGLTSSPQLTLYRGVTYVFNLTTTNNFYIKKTPGYGPSDLYSIDISGNGSSDQIIFSVTDTTPNVLYYGAENQQVAGGQIIIKTIEENSYIDIDKEILGKSQYKSGNGIEFINGLKISFGGDVRPAEYKNKQFIVEGVGDKIKLVDYNLLETPELTSTQTNTNFDGVNFDTYPFDNFSNLPITPAYITINRASKDLNPWTRYNRWFHGDVIRALAVAQGDDPVLPIENRAKRPIIEFKPDLQLFNFGNQAVQNVQLIDNQTTDAFSIVEGSPGYWVDNVELDNGYRIIFNADKDPLVNGKIYRVRMTFAGGNRVINLEETDDSTPFLGACATITKGLEQGGSVWHYTTVNGKNTWVKGQTLTTKNQAPLFDIVDKDGHSYGGSPYTSNFRGTKLFGYTEGTGIIDPVLGIPLKYKNVGLESSYLFTNYFTTDTFSRVFPDISETLSVSAGFIKSNEDINNPKFLNVWRDAQNYDIPVIQFQVLYTDVDQIEITSFDNPGYISNISIDVYLNDIKLHSSEYFISELDQRLFVNFVSTVPASTAGNKIKFEIYTDAAPNDQGYYDTPINLTNNPLNGPASEFTLSELDDHLGSMVVRDPDFVGTYPGSNNISRLPNIAGYGTRVIINKNPLSMAHYFISNKEHSVIDTLKVASDDYNQFKLNFIKAISELEDMHSPQEALDIVLLDLNKNKNTTFPYQYSDMVPYGTNKKTRVYTVTDSRNVDYSLSKPVDMSLITNTAVLVYLNGTQLIIDIDYTFSKYEPTVTFSKSLVKGDVITIEEYFDTDGVYICPTPTKLGLYPKFEPKIFNDPSYSTTSRWVIQGHDGSLLLAFGDYALNNDGSYVKVDYRDQIILEYEKRIYNNLKTTYNSNLFDVNSVLPGLFRKEEYTYSQLYSFIENIFLKWTGFYGVDYETNTTFNIDNHLTYNYKSAVDTLFGKSFPGSWRAIYKYYFDTDRPNTHPWEMLGITVKPDWWDSYYGEYPYTSGNLQLWKDLEEGRIAQGPNAGVYPVYARPGLSKVIPVDDSGNIIDPRQWASIGENDSIPDVNQSWAFGDCGPAENAFRRSSIWPFAVQILSVIAKPADYAAKLFDTSRTSKNPVGQYVYGSNNSFIVPSNLLIHSDVIDNVLIRSAGYSVYLVEVGKKRVSNYVSILKNDLNNGNFNLFAKLGGFVSQDKLSVVIDAVQLTSQNPTPYVPNEDYKIYFNVSNPIKTIPISGIIVIKGAGKFIIRGYDTTDLFFKIYKPIRQVSDNAITVGSKSEEFVTWAPNQTYLSGQIIYYQSLYYRVLSDHNSLTVFNKNFYTALPRLPESGGISVISSKEFETQETVIPYGIEMTTQQEVADFMSGYGRWLEAQGFIFDDYNNDFSQSINWDFSIKEFLYWTTQNWAENSVITLSPFANKINFVFQEGVVDNIFDSFYEYSLKRADGLPFPSKGFRTVRSANSFVVETKNTPDGIFFARLNLVQKEHTLILNNKTIFNDTIYKIDTGYRQRRIKLIGFKTGQWNGDFFSPGFVYDESSIESWTPYGDYMPSDIVEYAGKYYSALAKITGKQTFDFAEWTLLPKKPVAQLLPNFEYKITQFEDFYSLDIDNFDLSQQKMAQHLIGYSPRPYLQNIFPNEISQYKFYQGFIKEKGTINALTKLEKASAANLQGKLEIKEEWAFRLGSYGGYSSFKEIEIPLREKDFIESNQVITFVDVVPNVPGDLTSYVTPYDLSIKPNDYEPATTFKVTTSSYYENSFVLPHAGYVRLDDVEYTIPNLVSLLAINNNADFNEGDRFWVGFDGPDWNVYRYTRQTAYLSGVGEGSTTDSILFTTSRYHGLAVGDIISVARMDTNINGIYVVTNIPKLNEFEVNSQGASIPLNPNAGLLFKFKSVRFKNIDDISSLPYLAELKENEKFWIDDNGSKKWSVIKKVNNYAKNEYLADLDRVGQGFGFRIAKPSNTSTVIVSANQFNDITGGYGAIFVYKDVGGTLNKVYNYSLNSYSNQYRSNSDVASFGDAVFFDETDGLIFASASNANYVKADTTGFVRQARGENTPNAYTSAGLVKISEIYASTTIAPAEITYGVFTSPEPRHGTQFGAGLFVQRSTSTKRVLIGSPGISTSTSDSVVGKVYRYDINLSPNNAQFSTGVLNTGTSTGASFIITTNERKYYASMTSSGTNYMPGSIMIVPGNQLGGTALDNRLIIKVLTTNGTGSIVDFITSGTSAIKTFTFTTATSGQLTLPTVSELFPKLTTGSQFGSVISGDIQATRIAVSAPGYNKMQGGVFVYSYNTLTNTYLPLQSITKATNPELTITFGDKFGSSLLVSESGDYLIISSELTDDGIHNPGKVWIYKWTDGKYRFVQLLTNPSRSKGSYFGHAISINTPTDILSITARGTVTFNSVTFDKGNTVFDSEATRFGERTTDAGTAYVYNKFNEKFLLSQELFDNSVDNGSQYGESVIVNDHTVYVGSPNSIEFNKPNGSIYLWNEIIPNINSWQQLREEEDLVDISLIKKSTTINSLDQNVMDYVDIIDPLKGKIPGLADQEIRYKTAFDPAVYSIGTTSTAVVDSASYWSDDTVGELWWDLSTVKYVWYEQGDSNYRKTSWGQLFPGSSIDIYEWVKSEYLPSQWAALADTNAGLTLGISGTPKFADDSVLSYRQVYDKATNQFTNVYYYWVKNKAVVPKNEARRISASEVANLLLDPKGSGLEYLSIISPNSVALTNFKSKLISDRIYLNIAYDEIDSKVNRHTEWVLVQEDNEASSPPKILERKLVDSLLGKDNLGNLIPNPELPQRVRYGVEIRPKQSMFVDRQAALKNLLEYTNSVLQKNQITGNIDFSNLNSKEEIPDILLGEYDEIYENIEGRDSVITDNLQRAYLSCSVNNGKIVSVRIDDPGYGYKIAPTVTLVNTDVVAVIKTVIDSEGKVVDTIIVDPGKGFASAPRLSVRPYSVIVESDIDVNYKWSKYEWDVNSWLRMHTQDYDTTRYWSYIDWVDESYNKLIPLAYTVDELYELATLSLNTGDYVKVNNPGDGRFIILRKTDTSVVGTFNKDFDLIYSQNGTIKILDSIWDLTKAQLGFDDQTTFDQTTFDQTADIELQNILLAIKDDIFVGNLKIYWNRFFFKAVKYALTEQKFLDWAFKTSFINVKNIAGILDQRTTFRFQNSEWYESYLKEIKPYHSKIRNYQLNYQIGETADTPWENSYSYATDFDVPSYYDKTLGMFAPVTLDSNLVSTYPYKSWADNYTYKVESIIISNSGSGYRTTPKVDIIADKFDTTGRGATAEAYIAFGKISKIIVTNPGSGYTLTPTVMISGGGDTSLTPAVASAVLSNKTSRSNKVGIKFDRISPRREIGTTSTVVFSTSTTGIEHSYDLPWYSTTDKSLIDVTLDGIFVLDTDYTIVTSTKVQGTYHKKFSKLVLNTVPPRGKNLVATYKKNINLYSAVDRIEDYYFPENGMPGKQLGQLMYGVDYPETNVQGLPFSSSSFWEEQPYGAGGFDSAYVINYIQSTLTNTAIAGTDTVSLYSIDGISIGQTFGVQTSLPNNTYVKSINTASGTYTNVGVYSFASYTTVTNRVFTGVTATTVASSGTSATFTVSVTNTGTYFVALTNPGSGYKSNSTATITYDLIGGQNSANNLQILIISTGTDNGIVDFRYTGIGRTILDPVTFAVQRLDNNYSVSLANSGTGYTSGQILQIPGDQLGSQVVTNDLYITVTATNLTHVTGFTVNSGTPWAGTTATFDVYRSNGIYSVKLKSGGSGYTPNLDAGANLTVAGTLLGGVSPANDIQIRVLSVGDLGNIASFTYSGRAVSPKVKVSNTLTTTASVGSIASSYSSAVDASDVDSYISGGSLNTTTSYQNNAWVFENARGLSPTDIILDGDGFITSNTSHAPEEMVPGQIQESLAISVFTKPDAGSPLIVSQSSYITATNINVVIPLKAQPSNTSSVMVVFDGKYLTYDQDYFVNFVNKTITVNVAKVGILGITIVGIGGNEILSNRVVTVTGLTSVVIRNLPNYDTIGSSYVTSNGVTLSATTGTEYGYKLEPTSVNNRAAKLTVYGLSTGTNIIQTWFFAPVYKAFSEVKEQIINVTTSSSSFSLIQPPGILGPLHGQTIVEYNGNRLTPPDTTYYKVDSTQVTYAIKTDEVYPPGTFSSIEVYVNGIRIQDEIDVFLNRDDNSISFAPGYLARGDVVAIVTFLKSEYMVDASTLMLTTPISSGQLKVITYTNADSANIRTEVFESTGQQHFTISRTVIDHNYVWVSVNGRPLVNGLDYQILDNNQTVEIGRNLLVNDKNTVVITSFSDANVNVAIGYKIFKDMLGRTHYKRYSELDTAYLTQDLHITDTEIYVDNGNNLSTPVPDQHIPGVIFVLGERIEYFTKTNNVLGQLRRQTLGTGSREVYSAGTIVVDQGARQSIPYSEELKSFDTVTTATTSSVTSYVLDPAIINFNDTLDSTFDQLEVVYAGRLLQKPTKSGVIRYRHNKDLGFDSEDNNSDEVLIPEFTFTGTNVLQLLIPVEAGKTIKVIQRKASTWYNLGVGHATDGQSLLQSSTAQAKFLLERQSGAPDKYQYGQN